jgi:hypothetical protein
MRLKKKELVEIIRMLISELVEIHEFGTIEGIALRSQELDSIRNKIRFGRRALR